MACRNAKTRNQGMGKEQEKERLLFGVTSRAEANEILQNNLTLFEWVKRNKRYPNFWGRNINGENALSKEEIQFLHRKGCKIIPLYVGEEEKKESEGEIAARKAALQAMELGIPLGTRIFLEVGKHPKEAYLKGFAKELLHQGYRPGFRANTDSAFDFDREYGAGMQTESELFSACVLWATAPTLKDYDGITTTHLIHPDHWAPFAPSAVKRKEIALWEYGKNCHPIENDNGEEVVFSLNLVKSASLLTEDHF